jgi:hypothetical protein
MEAHLQALLAAARGERIGAEEAAARARLELAAARRARERLEDRLSAMERARRKVREQRADDDRDDVARPASGTGAA